MNIYSLKCIYEGSEIAFLDIEIDDHQSLKKLHETMIESLGYSGEQLASFYEINEDYEIINEISLADFMSENQQMEVVSIADVFAEEGDQLLYTYDFLNEIKFTIECIEIKRSEKNTAKLIKKYGTFPKENEEGVSNEEAESILLNAIMGQEFDEDFEEEEDLFGNEGFESLDDYEGLI